MRRPSQTDPESSLLRAIDGAKFLYVREDSGWGLLQPRPDNFHVSNENREPVVTAFCLQSCLEA